MDYAAEQAGIERRRRIAEALMQAGSEPMEINKMAGGQVIPVSPLSAVAKVAQQLAGAYLGKKADERGAKLDSERMQSLSGIDFSAPDAPAKLAQMGMGKEAVALAMQRARKGSADSSHIFAAKTIVKPGGKLGLVGLGSDGSVKEYDYEVPNDIQYVDTGGDIRTMFKKGAPGNIPQADSIEKQQGPNVINTGVPYSQEELAAIQQDFSSQQQPSAIQKTVPPAEQIRLQQAERGQQRDETRLGLSLEDQQLQREQAARQQQQFERQQGVAERDAALKAWRLENPNYEANQKAISEAEAEHEKLIKSLDSYSQELGKYDMISRHNPLKNSALQTEYQAATWPLRSESMINTGVLNPGDRAALEDALQDPTVIGPKGWRSTEELKKQISTLKSIADRNLDALKKKRAPSSLPPGTEQKSADDDGRKAKLEALRRELYGQ